MVPADVMQLPGPSLRDKPIPEVGTLYPFGLVWAKQETARKRLSAIQGFKFCTEFFKSAMNVFIAKLGAEGGVVPETLR